MPESKSGSKLLLIGAMWFLAIVFVAGLAWFRFGVEKPADQATQGSELQNEVEEEASGAEIDVSPEVVERAERLKNLAIAQIENERYAEAEETLLELRKLLPIEPLVERNLFIASLLHLQQDQGIRMFGGDQALRDSVVGMNLESIRGREVAHYLLGKLHEIERNIPEAMENFRQSTIQNPRFAAAWYSAFEASRSTRDEDLRRQGGESLARAVQLQPENTFLLVELLQIQVEAKEATVEQTLKQVQELVEPFREEIGRFVQVDLGKLFNDAISAAGGGDWGGVLRNVRILANVLRPQEIYQSDKGLVVPHLSSLMLRDFLNPLPRPENRSRFEPGEQISWTSVPFERLPEITDLLDLRLEDFDLDGKLDICLLRLNRIEVYSRSGDSENWSLICGIDLPQGYQRLILADLDNDFEENQGIAPAVASGGTTAPCQAADLDVIVFGSAGISLLENRYRSEEKLRELLPRPLEASLDSQRPVRACDVSDLDGDGDLDLVVLRSGAIQLWANRGGMDFYDISARSVLPEGGAANVVLIGDRDFDVDQDILVVGGDVNGVLENMRHGRFVWRRLPWQHEARFTNVVDADIGGRDPERSWRVIMSDGDDLVEAMPFRQPEGRLSNSGIRGILSKAGARRVRAADFDNDGVLDLLTWGEAGLTVRLMVPREPRPDGSRRGGWEPRESFVQSGKIAAADFGDLDGDGDLDVIWGDEGGIHQGVNEGGNRNHWLEVSLIAQQIKQGGTTPSGRVNSHGIGGVVELKSGADYQARNVRRPRTHLGLGARTQADVLRVLWPNGIPGNLIDPKGNQFLCEQQTLKGSCPYLYSWNGEKIEFVTDLLWGAPIGLQFGEGVLATPREWEYLKIPGEFVREREGRYDLRITEELWEAAYFDEVKLFAVDHPAEVEIETNEKVGPPSVAEHRIFTVREKRLPVAAKDSRGNDLLAALSRKDDDYVQTYGHKLRQGLAEEHFLELDLGKLPKFEHLHLYLTGWLYPTDTSINVAISRDPRLSPPRPPAIQVPDAEGNWQTVVPFCGFPGGKTKTVVYDLSKVFLTEDYRVRMVSNMEFYWDAVWFTVNEPGGGLEMQELPLREARLRYRGFSAPVTHSRNGPERYEYAAATEEARWPGLQGNLTRYGGVKELIAASDDRLVVMAGGDEMQLEFEVPSKSPPSGWKRDFVLYNVGWDKDADLNTVTGTSVEPLPYRRMDAYPPVTGEGAPADEAYLEYLSTYQTRTQSPRRFWSHVLTSTVDSQP